MNDIVAIVRDGPAPEALLIGTGPRGEKGDPGGNIMAIGLFTDASGLAIPVGTDAVRTSGHTIVGLGIADYIYDASVNSAYVTANPRTSFLDTNGRGFRLSPDQELTVLKFGALGDDTSNDAGAFVAALAFAEAAGKLGYGLGKGSPRLRVPGGRAYFLATTTLEITTTLIFEGDSVGEAGGGASVLRWSAGATGIRVQRYNTTGATGTLGTANAYGGDASIIRGLHLKGGYTATDGEFHGIHLRARASIRDVYIDNFEGDGIHMKANAGATDGTEGNCNNWEITKAIITHCRKGVDVGVADANAGVGTAIDVMACRDQGIDDNSFLGNVWIMCHTSGNGAEPYRTTNLNAQSVFVGCYAESDQIASSFQSATVIIGGQLASTVAGTGSYIHSNAKGCRVERDLTVKKTFVDDELGNASLVLDAFSNTATIMFRKQESTDTGFIQLTNGTGLLLATYGADDNIRLRPGNVDCATVDKTGIVMPAGKTLMGGDGGPPTTGTWARGQIILNALPVAGGFAGWICVAAGTPGTWKGFGTIEA